MAWRRMLSIALVLLTVRPPFAYAYNWATHSAIVEVAVKTMQDLPGLGTPAPPPGVPANEWSAFLAAVHAAPLRLGLLRTGLPNVGPVCVAMPGPNPDTPPTSVSTGGYPFSDNACTPENEAGHCEVFREDNLDHIDLMRIADFRYVPKRTASPCGVEKDPTSFTHLPEILGWHAGSIDDRADDSVIWVRPTSVAGLGVLHEIASTAWIYAVGAIALPFVCAWEALIGDGCDLEDALELASQYNPVDYVEGWIPGFGEFRDAETYAGLWHFINLDSDGVSFNDIPGMEYPHAGPDYPGAMDVFIMAGADLAGLSLKAGASAGDDIYGRFDRRHRFDPAWQAYTIGHLEFSPIDNLAQHGVDVLADGHFTSAQGLSWPLHAIGDAAEPHHVSGTSSWGHRPYEDFVEQQWGVIIRSCSLLCTDRDLDEDVLASGFQWWHDLKHGGTIETLVINLARQTQQLVEDGWPYEDLQSVRYTVDASAARSSYFGKEGRTYPLVKNAMGASLGFLAFVAEQVTDPGLDPLTRCPTDTHYVPGMGCQPGPGPTPSPRPTADPGLCLAGQTCGTCRKVCTTNEDCPPNELCGGGCCTLLM